MVFWFIFKVGDANGLALAQVNLADLQNMLCAGDEANVKRVNRYVILYISLIFFK